MTKHEIIRKAVKKAENNGYSNRDADLFIGDCLWEMIIFNHNFAKAFWGEEQLCLTCGYPEGHKDQCFEWSPYYPAWQFHLLQIILEKEPLKYLEKFL